jgi:AcrR family transcriptional regulator
MPTETVRRRRRGSELEHALLEAAWDELLAVGFAHLTMESIAARAHTGIAVLYRRWPNKSELVIAAIAHYGRTHPLEIPDTGNLRDDLIGLLTSLSESRANFMGVIAAAGFSGLLADTGLTPAEVRERFLDEHRIRGDQVIYRRADEREEIALAQIPAAALSMPFDLVRHDLLMNLGPVPARRIRSIVDDVALPLLRSYPSRATR